MPVLKKKGALFPVYHDSPSATATASSKKDVLAARSPTLRHRKQSSLGSKNALGALKSDATQTQGPRKPLGPIGNATGRHATRDGGKSGTAAEKENMRSVGMGKPKMHVFVDDEVDTKPIKPIQTRLGTRRALGDKAQPTHAITALNPHKPKPSSTLLPEPTFGRGQENIPPPGEYTADRPPPVPRSTRRTTAATFPPPTFTSVPHPVASTPGRQGNPHDSVLDPDSPYVTKPRLRKVRPLSATTVEQASTLTEPSSQPPLIASSQPQSHSQSQGTLLHSSPLVTRPQTRKRPANVNATRHPDPTAPPIRPDPILYDLTEPSGADPSLPTTSPGPRRSTRLLRAPTAVQPVAGLPESAYGWVQLSAGRFQAPEPPAPRGRRQKKGTW